MIFYVPLESYMSVIYDHEQDQSMTRSMTDFDYIQLKEKHMKSSAYKKYIEK